MNRIRALLFDHSTIPIEVFAVFYSIAWGIRAVIAEELLGNIVTPDRAFIITYLRLTSVFIGVLYGIVLLNHAQNLRKFMMGCLTIIWACMFFLTLMSLAHSDMLMALVVSLVYFVVSITFGWTFLRMRNGTIREFHAIREDLSRKESEDAFLLQINDLRERAVVQNDSIIALTKEIAGLLVRIKVLESLVMTMHD